jgi:hypothetical protein
MEAQAGLEVVQPRPLDMPCPQERIGVSKTLSAEFESLARCHTGVV